MRITTVTVAALLAAVAFTGCIANLRELRDTQAATEESLDAAAASIDAALNATEQMENESRLAPPVARIAVFGAAGALVYKSTFQAEDPEEVVLVPEKSTLNLIGSDSEAIAAGATIVSFSWTLQGKPVEGGRQATIEVGEPGVYPVTLVVTDSNGKTDNQTLKLGVAPTPYDVVLELKSGPVAGGEGQGTSAEVPFELKVDEAKGPAMVQKVVVKATPPLSCDAILEVLGPDGSKLGSADDRGFTNLDQTETVTLGAVPLGAYTVALHPYACAAPDGIPVTVTITFLPHVEGLGDGHAHAH